MNLNELARKAAEECLNRTPIISNDGTCHGFRDPDIRGIILSALQQARAQALEDAARECESHPQHEEECQKCGQKVWLKRDERLVHDTHAEYAGERPHRIYSVIPHGHVWAARIRAMKDA